jgi:hypothetical protein
MIGASIDAVEPFGAGQRYFFYVYIVLSFVLLWLSTVTRPWKLQLVPSLVLVSAALLVWLRTRDFDGLRLHGALRSTGDPN